MAYWYTGSAFFQIPQSYLSYTVSIYLVSNFAVATAQNNPIFKFLFINA